MDYNKAVEDAMSIALWNAFKQVIYVIKDDVTPT